MSARAPHHQGVPKRGSHGIKMKRPSHQRRPSVDDSPPVVYDISATQPHQEKEIRENALQQTSPSRQQTQSRNVSVEEGAGAEEQLKSLVSKLQRENEDLRTM